MNCLYPLVLDMRKVAKPENRAVLPPTIEVPCGRCIKCLLDKNYEWSFRGTCELLSKKSVGTFLTLTYDDEHNPMRVSKRQAQLFIKRLKDYWEDDFTYMLTSEYGDEGMRPHYHVCLFGVDLFCFLNDGGDHTTKVLARPSPTEIRFKWSLWKEGFCHCEPLIPQKIDYTLKYLLKSHLRCGKYKSYNDMLEDCGFEPLFFLKSQGIGKQYFLEHKAELQDKGGLMLNGKFHVLPVYWQKYFDVGGQVMFTEQWYKQKRFRKKAQERPKGMSTYEIENQIIRSVCNET